MYLEYLTDRIGGPSVAQDLRASKPNAWSNPAIIKALTDIQQLAKAGAFQSGYDSLHYSGGGSDALVYSGKAAMQLMGDWDVSQHPRPNKSFVTGGNLGMAPFPTVDGGTGNPADLAGNTASYVAISSNASAAQKSVAEAFFQDALASPQLRQGRGRRGRGAGHQGRRRRCSPASRWPPTTQTIYNSVQSAPSFQYSWDQAMTPQVATPMLTNLAQVFELSETPEKFESANTRLRHGS